MSVKYYFFSSIFLEILLSLWRFVQQHDPWGHTLHHPPPGSFMLSLDISCNFFLFSFFLFWKVWMFGEIFLSIGWLSIIVMWVKLYKMLCTFICIPETFGGIIYCKYLWCKAGDTDCPWWLADLIFSLFILFMKWYYGHWLAGERNASERELLQFAVFKKYFGLIDTSGYLTCLSSLIR